ncbi:uncharacterized protein LOC129589843 [Paramacrobiotus metropolitanus]|uniref:uncharacterized protein LOC129589843 n=1 Tax=Paramacrobiotus metropolitanus TaxID=2943436 RepID=UPI0024461EE7|nr:uncharacterized protein LOC129589843 [Paramacrobiotus metropolitanus]
MDAIAIEPEIYGKTCRYLYDMHDPRQRIGQGGFGSVCKATITDYGNYVGDGVLAVKVIYPRRDAYADEVAKNKMRSRFQKLLEISNEHIATYQQVIIDFTTFGDTFTVKLLMDFYIAKATWLIACKHCATKISCGTPAPDWYRCPLT